jgi:multiple sugar transport system substrate-binding protein
MRQPRSDRSDHLDSGRRRFLAGAAALSAAAGLEGILAARRAPAFAQGTKLHIVRWVDFIPEADVELKRQAPEASKALGAEVQFEFINANDLQPRITAAVQSGAGADLFQMLYNWAAPLRQRPRGRVRRGRAHWQGAGRLL